ncbi:hypothetical protein V1511DRAFT_23935 [Dipodascopsis uninucleata]
MQRRRKNHYEVLGIKAPMQLENIPGDVLKKAYRSALLLHHPDKAINSGRFPSEQAQRIDDIRLAYMILSSPDLRKKYDAELAGQVTGDERVEQLLAQSDYVDLDDLTEAKWCPNHGLLEEEPKIDEPLNNHCQGCNIEHVWYRECRCGKQDAYVVSDAMLEDAISLSFEDIEHDSDHVLDGDLLIQCMRCSTYIHVLFSAE